MSERVFKRPRCAAFRRAARVSLLLGFLVSAVSARPHLAEASSAPTQGLGLTEPSDGLAMTVEERFVDRTQSFGLTAFGALPVRRDLNQQWALGLEGTYHPNSRVGVGLRWLRLVTEVGEEARALQTRLGVVQSARPQRHLWLFTVQPAVGYGKLQTTSQALIHMEPDLVLGAGAALAEGSRLVPSFVLGPSLVFHFRFGLQAKLNLEGLVQVEPRRYGPATSLAFLPSLGFGWSSAARSRR